MNLRRTSWALVVALVLFATAAFAQDQKQDTSPIDPNAPLQPLDTRPSGAYGNKPPTVRHAVLTHRLIPSRMIRRRSPQIRIRSQEQRLSLSDLCSTPKIFSTPRFRYHNSAKRSRARLERRP